MSMTIVIYHKYIRKLTESRMLWTYSVSSVIEVKSTVVPSFDYTDIDTVK